MNNYLIESLDSLSLEKQKQIIIQDNHMEKITPSIYDLEETELQDALEDLDTYGLFSNKKIIIIKNIEVLKYDENKEKIDHLIKYIDNPNPDYLLIIEAKKLNNTTKITKELKKKCQYQKVEFNLNDYVKGAFSDYKISPKTINYLIEYCENDFTKIQNECNKLKDYKLNEKEINIKDIEEIVVKKQGDSQNTIFSFSRAIAEKNKKEALELYKELLLFQIEPLSIIGLLASQIRIIYQVKLLEKEKLNDKEIASTLGEKSDYRIKKTRELTRLYSEEELLLLMQKLSDMDYQIKTTDVNGNSLIELLIINLN